MDAQLKMTARYILILYPPTIEPPFNVRLGVQTNVEELRSTGDFMIVYCNSVQDGVDKALQVVQELNLPFAEDFTIVYPMFNGKDEEEEAKIIDTAWKIKAVADEKGWLFSRTIPIYDY